MRPTELLQQDHTVIKSMLGILDKVCQRLDSGKEVEPEHLEQILDFIRVFGDKCHHSKEETLLFPAMEKAGIPKEGGPIGMMLMEHDEGRGYVRGMAEAIAAYKRGEKAAAAKFVKNARNYVGLLTQHIEKEDNILYPMAEMHVSEDTEKQLLAGFEKLEREVIGAGAGYNIFTWAGTTGQRHDKYQENGEK